MQVICLWSEYAEEEQILKNIKWLSPLVRRGRTARKVKTLTMKGIFFLITENL